MFDKLSPSILILLLVLFRPSATQHNNHLIAELLLSWDTSSNCPGTIAVFDHFYWTEDVEFIDELVQDWRRPLTLLQSHNRGLTMDDGDGNWGGGGDYDIDDSKLLCANIIIFSRSAQNLGKIHRQVTERFAHIGRIVVVTQGPSDMADRFLHEYGRTKHHILLVMDEPWMRNHLEIRTCCYGPDRHVRRQDYVPKHKTNVIEDNSD